MKIINKKRFIMTILIILGGFIILWLNLNNTYSKGKIYYKENYIIQGDTLWSIAEHEVNTNIYYKNKDIRKVMYEIKKINKIENRHLVVGEKILIPYI